MRVLGNVIWFIFGGWLASLYWLFAGAIFCVTLIGIPLGLQCFKYARLSLAPYGKKIELNLNKHFIANVIWLIFFGWEMFLGYVLIGCLCCLTLIGIPAGIQAFKFSKLSFAPFGARIN